MNKQEILKKLENFYNDMTDEQFKEHFEKTGLEVFQDESGELVLEDYEEFELPNPIQIKRRSKSKYNVGRITQKKWEMDLSGLRKVI